MEKSLQIVIIGPTCAGKSAAVSELSKLGYVAAIEPNNDAFPLFINNPKSARHAILNQVNKLSGLAVQALTLKKEKGKHTILESSVIAPIIYGWYFLEKGIINQSQYEILLKLHQNFLEFFRPDMVFYLEADEKTIGKRAGTRSKVHGKIAIQVLHTHEMKPHFERLILSLQISGIPVIKIDTTHLSVKEVAEKIDNEIRLNGD